MKRHPTFSFRGLVRIVRGGSEENLLILPVPDPVLIQALIFSVDFILSFLSKIIRGGGKEKVLSSSFMAGILVLAAAGGP